MDDLISRQAAIDTAMNDSLIINAMDSVKDGDIHRTKRAIVRLLASLPSIDAVPQWIPCSERLPKEVVVVVTVDKDGDYEINAIIDEEDCEWFWEKPVAWMPLPKPYKEEEE